MSLFRRGSRDSGTVQPPAPPSQPDGRPEWMLDGMQAVQLGGAEDLAVVGESRYQHDLWCLVGQKPGGERIRAEVTALLVAEDGNPHDSNAIAVWIYGLRAGIPGAGGLGALPPRPAGVAAGPRDADRAGRDHRGRRDAGGRPGTARRVPEA
jgi:hypothetical protein